MNIEEQMDRYNRLMAQMVEEKLESKLHTEIAVATIEELMLILRSMVRPGASEADVEAMVSELRGQLAREFL